jgi:NADH:ubiquinone oxidoreductase subunit 2 (subunit N)
MEQVMPRLALEYFWLAFIAAVGVLQVVAAYNGLRGVSFFSRKAYGYLFAAFTVGPALALFFTWNLRNPTGIIEGREQFGFFILALAASIGFTLVASSLLNNRRLRGNYARHDGLEALREMTFFQALRDRFGRRR